MKNKRILMSLAMLLVSAIMLSSASYAWFSMNTDVSVEGIQFEAYSDSLFLEISNFADSGYESDVISADTERKSLLPIAYGTLDDMGGAWSVSATPASGYFETDTTERYYRKVQKTDTNDTYVGEVDYICVNEELYGASEINFECYILGEGIKFVPVTTSGASNVYKKVGNSYVPYTPGAEGSYGYYTVDTTAAASGEYNPDKQYYMQATDGSWVVVDGLQSGSHLEGYYTLTVSRVSSVAEGETAYIKSVRSDNDPYPNYYAFNGHTYQQSADHSNKNWFDEYWFRGYSDNLTEGSVAETPTADSQPGRIIGVVDMDRYTTETSPYYLYDTFYLRMAEGSGDATHLRISNITIDGSDSEFALTDAIRVLIVARNSLDESEATDVTAIMYNNDTGTFTRHDGKTTNDPQLLFETLRGNTGEVVTVEIYVFYDGRDPSVATHNQLNLSGHKLSIGFEIEKPYYVENP